MKSRLIYFWTFIDLMNSQKLRSCFLIIYRRRTGKA